MGRILLKDIIEKVSKEDVINEYITSNKSQKECADALGITVRMFNHLIRFYGIHKDQSLHMELIKKSKLSLHGDENYNNREKAKQTCVERYGVDNPFKDKEHIKEAWKKSYGVDHPMKTESIKQKVISKIDYAEAHLKAKQTCLEKYGVDNPAKLGDFQRKGIETKIKNGVYDSPHTSNLERRLEKILKRKFCNVECGYRDDRYARDSGYKFECDFYIPSEDLFIELNAHPTHGKHPFNCMDDLDIKRSNALKESVKPWDKSEYETWTVRDVEKHRIAKEKGLNYIVLYPTASIHENVSFNDKKHSDLIKFLLKKLLKI